LLRPFNHILFVSHCLSFLDFSPVLVVPTPTAHALTSWTCVDIPIELQIPLNFRRLALDWVEYARR
jgi:hypothetical protein